jgi:hypothetical protein
LTETPNCRGLAPESKARQALGAGLTGKGTLTI